MKNNWIILYVILFFWSCQNIDKSKNIDNSEIIKQKRAINIEDTIVSEQVDFDVVRQMHLDKELNIDILNNGSENFELRFWTTFGPTNGGKVLIIKKVENEWVCFDYYFHKTRKDIKGEYTYYKQATNFTVDSLLVKKKQPMTNWKTFFSEIKNQNIYTLPSQSELEGYKSIVDDGYGYTVEFAYKWIYRTYYYNCPDLYENEFVECRNMTNIAGIFDKEFDMMPYGYRCKKTKKLITTNK